MPTVRGRYGASASTVPCSGGIRDGASIPMERRRLSRSATHPIGAIPLVCKWTILSRMATRTQAPSPQKADELAQAAFALFCSRGIDGVNLDQIAAAAGVTKGSLYWHYSSKKDVILAAADLYYTRWREEMAAATGPAVTMVDKLEAAIAYSVRSCLLNDANRIFSTEVIALSVYDSDLRASWANFQDEVDRFFLGLTHQAVGNGEL